MTSHLPMPFNTELKKIGLTDKEAAVYQAALELGPSPVQPIARKSKVARATTYLVLEDLLKKGLITRFVEGKKTMFIAEPPHQLERLLDKRAEQLQEHRDHLQRLLPELQAFMKTVGDQPTVRYYDGLDGLRAMRSEMTLQTEIWYNWTHADLLQKAFGSHDFSYVPQRRARGISSKTIFTTTSSEIKEQFLRTAAVDRVQRKFIEPEKYRSSSVATIFGDRVAIAILGAKYGGVVIESASVAQMMKDWFDLLWDALD